MNRLSFALVSACVMLTSMTPVFAEGGVTLRPSVACQIEIQPPRDILVRKLDETRIQLSWSPLRGGGVPVSTEVRFGCSSTSLSEQLEAAGFEERNGKWMFAGGNGTPDVSSVNTSTWAGMSATYFSGNVCHAAVGKERVGTAVMTIDFCVDESEYERVRRRLSSWESHVSLSSTP